MKLTRRAFLGGAAAAVAAAPLIPHVAKAASPGSFKDVHVDLVKTRQENFAALRQKTFRCYSGYETLDIDRKDVFTAGDIDHKPHPYWRNVK